VRAERRAQAACLEVPDLDRAPCAADGQGAKQSATAGADAASLRPGQFIWTPDLAPADPGAVARDLSMFRAFEPAAPTDASRVTVTVGGDSPPVRHLAAARLHDVLGLAVEVLPGCAHAVHLDHADVLADRVIRLLA